MRGGWSAVTSRHTSRRLVVTLALLLSLGGGFPAATSVFGYTDPNPRAYDAVLDSIRVVLTTPSRALRGERTRLALTAYVPVVVEAVGVETVIEIRKLGPAADVVVTRCLYVPQPADIGTTVAVPCHRFEVVPVEPGDAGPLLVYPHVVRGASQPAATLVHDGRSTPLTLDLLGDDAFEPNDTLATASDLGDGESVAHPGLVSRNPDYYRVSVPAGKGVSRVQVDFWNGASDLDLFLYADDGRLLGVSQTGRDVEVLFVSLTAGAAYFVRVDNHGGLPVFYDLSVEHMEADAVAILSGPESSQNPVGPRRTVSLSVTAADSLGHPLSYLWTVDCPTLANAGTLSNATSRTASWRAPRNDTGEQQTCTVGVTVTDDVGRGETSTFVHVVDPLVESLTFISGPSGAPNPVASGGLVTLDASAADSAGHPIAFEWLASCPLPDHGTFIPSRFAQTPEWQAPANLSGVPQRCQIIVTVSDAFSHTTHASLAVAVESAADVVTLLAGPTATPDLVTAGHTADLSVTAADALDHPLSYSWSTHCPDLADHGSFDDATSQAPRWTAPANPFLDGRTCTLSVVAADDYGHSAGRSTTVVVAGVGYSYYFAEGATIHGFFNTTLALFNPDGATTATVDVSFQLAGGDVLTYRLAAPARTRVTLDVGALALAKPELAALRDAEFSLVVHADRPLVVERSMGWDRDGYGSHTEAGVPAPASTWYIAEGATNGALDLYYLIQNPNDVFLDNEIEVTYFRPPPAVPVVRTYSLGAHARRNIVVDLEPGLDDTEVSAVIRTPSGKPVVVERAMYLTRDGWLYSAGHAAAAVASPAQTWFFAEGATGPYLDSFMLIFNPQATNARVTATFAFDDGTTCSSSVGNAWEGSEKVVGAGTRFNLWADAHDVAGCPRSFADAAFATTISADVPIVAERTMWWPGPTAATWAEAHSSAGAVEGGLDWGFAGGEQGGRAGAETYLLIANLSGYDGTARVTLYFEDGTAVNKLVELLRGRRTSVPIGAPRDPLRQPGGLPERSGFGFSSVAADRRFSVVIESLEGEAEGGPASIVVERSSYADAVDGTEWASGTNIVGTKLR